MKTMAPVLILLCFLFLTFQNCSNGFESNRFSQTSSSSTDTGPGDQPDPTPEPTPDPIPDPDPDPPPGDPSKAPLLQKSNMSYLGAFALPELNGDLRFGYGGRGITPHKDPQTGKLTLFMEGHAWFPGFVAQVEVPSSFVKSKNWNQLPQAKLLQNFARITDNKGSTLGGNSAGNNFIYGMLSFNGRLIVASANSYDADSSQTASHGASSFNLASQTDFTGYYGFNAEANPRSLGGYMTTIPSEWQSLFGGPALTGNCCLSIIAASSTGPALTVFNPDDVGVKNPIPGKTLLFYPLGHDFMLDNFNTLSGGTSKGIAFPAGSSSVLFIGRSSNKEYCYGPGTNDQSLHGKKTDGGTWCYDPCDSSKGGHGYPYYHQVLAYDAHELLQVKNGQKQPWEIMPYATWQLDEMNNSGCAGIKAAGFDQDSGRLFVTQEFSEDAQVDVYQIYVPTGK